MAACITVQAPPPKRLQAGDPDDGGGHVEARSSSFGPHTPKGSKKGTLGPYGQEITPGGLGPAFRSLRIRTSSESTLELPGPQE